MITASHNENGWTGIKMGIEKGLTHCKDEMSDLKDIVLNEKFSKGSGKYEEVKDFNKTYIHELSQNKIKKKLKVVAACGNGTAGIFAPDILRGIGCDVIELDCNLDYTFQGITLIQRIWRCFMKSLNVLKKIKQMLVLGLMGMEIELV